jgi:hypothetical protein
MVTHHPRLMGFPLCHAYRRGGPPIRRAKNEIHEAAVLLSIRHVCAMTPPAIAIAAVLMATAAARAAEVPPCQTCAVTPPLPTADIVPDTHGKLAVPPDDPAVQVHPPGCAIWTDRCVTCERDAGKTSCSNIGVVCQPQAVECVRATPEEKKENSKKQEN